MKYARVLLANCPQQTTELFITYYTGKFQPRTVVESPAEPQVQPSSTLQSLAGFLPLGLINVGSDTEEKKNKPEPQNLDEDKSANPVLDYQIPHPRAAFSAFVDHPQEFVTFLEALVNQPNPKEEDKVDLFTTLFEMYLDTAKRQKDATDRAEWENKAKNLIEGKDVSFGLPAYTYQYLTGFGKDSYFDIKCPTAIRLVWVPGWVNPGSRARRPSV